SCVRRSAMMHPERRPSPQRSPESLEARLRALPQPPVPADLEGRLLAAIPAEKPIGRRRAAWIGAVGALAAACLLAVLVWPERGTDPITGTIRPVHPVASSPDDSASIAAWRQSRRVLDGAEPPAFTWPLEATAIPLNRFD